MIMDLIIEFKSYVKKLRNIKKNIDLLTEDDPVSSNSAEAGMKHGQPYNNIINDIYLGWSMVSPTVIS